VNNVKRACGEAGAWPATPTLITKAGICNAMQQTLGQAVKKHADGAHAARVTDRLAAEIVVPLDDRVGTPLAGESGDCA